MLGNGRSIGSSSEPCRGQLRLVSRALHTSPDLHTRGRNESVVVGHGRVIDQGVGDHLDQAYGSCPSSMIRIKSSLWLGMQWKRDTAVNGDERDCGAPSAGTSHVNRHVKTSAWARQTAEYLIY